jgi:hypothetical protein
MPDKAGRKPTAIIGTRSELMYSKADLCSEHMGRMDMVV